MKKIKTLLIDDDKLFLHLTEKLIKDAAFLENVYTQSSVTEAKQYLDACEKSESLFPDLILVDMNMPEMNGIEFAEYYERRHAKRHPGTRLVILTSSISRKEKTTALEKPVISDFIQKPITVEMLYNLFPVGSLPTFTGTE